MSIERNPFVGPEPLDAVHGIYGRDEEIRELLWLFTAERIVWLHSPSGAGKTSLVQAGLIPQLTIDDFEVLPTIRANRQGSNGMNRYEASALTCLAARRDEGSGLFKLLAENKTGRSRVLIFDQFEEILTADSTDTAEKKSFFETLGRVLCLPDIWALFVVREDFLPALDPYARYIPTLMNHRFRLDLLPVKNACEAMEGIAASGGRTFRQDASESLAKELSKIRLHVGGKESWKQGSFVEPVILQVVCVNLWKELPADQLEIETRHVPTGPNVSQCLANYYAACVNDVSKTPIQERNVRAWIGDRLITSGVRNQVLDASGNGADLGLSLVSALVRTHLVRRDDRGDRTWYELAHDRLIEPVLQDNARWEEENLHWVQRRASLWRVQGRPRTLLLLDEDLQKAKDWKKELQSPLTEDERAFVEESEEEQKVRDKVRNRTRLAWIAAAVASALFLATAYSYLGARARELTNLALLALRDARDGQIGCAAQHGRDALSLARYLGTGQHREAMEALEEVLQGDRPQYEMPSGDNLILAFSQKASLVVTATDRQVDTYGVDVHGALQKRLGHRVVDTDCALTAISLNTAGDVLALGMNNGQIQRVGASGDGDVACGTSSGAAIEGLAFSATGVLASASGAGIKIDDRTVLEVGAKSVAFRPDGALLAAGLENGQVQILRPGGTQEQPPLALGKDPVSRLAWARGVLAAVSRFSGTVGLWKEDIKPESPFPVHEGGITAVAIAPDESVFATAGLDRTVRIWRTGSSSPWLTLRTPPAKEEELTDLLFLDPTHLLVAYKNGVARLFPLDDDSLRKSATDIVTAYGCAGTDGSGSQ
jgi:hypothetical protein